MSKDEFLIEMDRLHNLREVAGYATRSGVMRAGRLYRSGAWELMSAADHAWFEEAIETVIDLRHPDEIARAAHVSGGEPRARVVFNSIFPVDQTMESAVDEMNGLYGDATVVAGAGAQRYLHFTKVGGTRFADAVRVMADPANYPVLINCVAGKDRTGLLVGMVMDVLGVADEEIASEYERSNADIEGLLRYLGETGRVMEGTAAEIRARVETPGERMVGFLEGLRGEYGSSAGFLQSHGVGDVELESLEALLTEPPSGPVPGLDG
jgi:protein-tyrosine phosphatase